MLNNVDKLLAPIKKGSFAEEQRCSNSINRVKTRLAYHSHNLSKQAVEMYAE